MFLGISTLATALIPMWLFVKGLTFAMGFTYFALYPIAVNFPEYRLLVSPTKRLLWNIPTHGTSIVNWPESHTDTPQRSGQSSMSRPKVFASPKHPSRWHLYQHSSLPHLTLSTTITAILHTTTRLSAVSSSALGALGSFQTRVSTSCGPFDTTNYRNLRKKTASYRSMYRKSCSGTRDKT